MKELSIFIDESGDFGEYAYHSLSKSEKIFFGSVNDLKRNYLKNTPRYTPR